MWLGMKILLTFVIAIFVDFICLELDLKKPKFIQLLKQMNLLISTLIIYGFIYISNLIAGDYFVLSFPVGMIYLISMDIQVKKSLIRKIIHIAGLIGVSSVIIYASLYTRYELQTRFFKPCWSPDGKQIAFFMEKALYRYHLGFPFSFWSPDDIWKKNYLCTMDYDGKNFRQIKQTEQATDEISWSGSGEIVYTQYIRLNVDIILQRKIMYTSPDGKETGMLYETAKIPTNDLVKGNERILDPWLSRDKRYLGFVLNYQEPKKDSEEDIRLGRSYDNYKLMVKDLKTQQTKIDILQRDVKYGKYIEFYGSYKENKIAYQEDMQIIIRDLEPNKVERIDTKNIMAGLPMGYDVNPMYRSDAYSPDRQMYAGVGRAIDIAGVGVNRNTERKEKVSEKLLRDKRSYLFNIFSE